MKTLLIILTLLTIAPCAYAQQVRNLEVQPDGTGGYIGTYGNQNFQVPPNNGPSVKPNVSRRHVGPPPVVIVPNGSVNGDTHKRCYVDGNGQASCY